MSNRVNYIAVVALLVLSLVYCKIEAQSEVLWSQTYGGEKDETFQDIFITEANGAQVIGWGQSNAGTVKSDEGLYDMIICEMGADGQLRWTSSIGGSQNDLGKSIFIENGRTFIGGLSYSTDLDQKINLGAGDILFANLDEDHQMSQSSLFGGNKLDNIVGIQMHPDGSIILAANTNSTDVAISGVGGATDIYVCQLLTNGTILWETTIGGNGVDKAADMVINNEGDIIIVGTSFSDNFLEYRKGKKDGFVLCMSNQGTHLWGKRFSNGNYSSFVACDVDGQNNIVITGIQGSINNTNSGINGIYNEDIWALKIDEQGNEIWRKLFGGSANDFATDIVVSLDGGMLIVGNTESYNGLVNTNLGVKDAFALKLDAAGNRLWSKGYGGSKDDAIHSVTQDKKGHYWLTGNTASDDNDLKENLGGSDAWILKLEGEKPAFQIELGDSIEACLGESIQIDAGISFCECTYVWSDGFEGAQRTIVANNNITLGLTVIDQQGNIAVDQIEIIAHPKPDFEFSTIDPTCADSNNGEINLTSIQALPPLSFDWNNGESSESLMELGTGNYSLTLTDANSCTVAAEVSIESPSPISITSDILPATCENRAGQILLDVQGGSGSYTFDWSNGGTESNNTNLNAGNYEATISDTNGCSIEAAFEVEQNMTDFNLEFSIENNACFSSADGLIAIINDVDIASFSWSNGSNESSISTLESGTYELEYVTLDGCTATQMFNITEPSLLEVAPNASDITCFGESNGGIGLELRGGTQPYRFEWSNGATTPLLSGLSEGTYMVTITDDNDCSVVISEDIEAPSEIEVLVAVIEDESCGAADNGAINIAAEGGIGTLSYIWSNGANTANISDLDQGTYLVTITDLNDCSTISTYQVNETAPFELGNIIVKNESCENANDASIEINTAGSLGSLTFNWSDGSTGAYIDNLSEGDYQVTATDSNGCEAFAEVSISEADEFPAILIDQLNPKCNDGGDGVIALHVENPDLEVNYFWPDGFIGNERDDLEAGTYEILVETKNGCTQVMEITLTAPALFDIDLIAQEVSCFEENDGSITVNASGGLPPYVISVQNENDFSFALTNNTVAENLETGVYTVEVIDANGCLQESSIAISAPDMIVIQGIVTDASCFGLNDGAIETVVSGGVGSLSYFWGGQSTSNSIEDINAGIYLVEVTDENGCLQERTFQVNQPDDLVVENTFTQPSQLGDDGSIVLNISGGTSPYTVAWDHGAEGTSISNLSNGSYRYQVSDKNDCQLFGGITLSGTTSTQQIQNFKGVDIFPNPVNKLLNIQVEQVYTNVHISVISPLGQKLLQSYHPRIGTDIISFDTSQLPSGLYHLQVSNNDYQSTFKLVVAHD